MFKPKNKNEITYWLDKINYNKDPLIYELENNNINNYYMDSDLKKNETRRLKKIFRLNHKIETGQNLEYIDEQECDNLLEDSEFVQEFTDGEDKYLYYYNNQYTNRYDINMLFNQMIDYCIKNNKGEYYVTKEMRPRFIEFCYKNNRNYIEN